MNGADRDLAALESLAAEVLRRRDAASAYEDLLAAEAARLFLRREEGFLALDPPARRSAFERFASLLPAGFSPALAAAIGRAAELYKEELAALRPLPARVRCALVDSRYAPHLHASFPPDAEFVFCGGFEEACEKAVDGAVDACLLPLFDDSGRLLARTARLVGENGLKCLRLIEPEIDEEALTFGFFAPYLCDLPAPAGAELSFLSGAPGADGEKLAALCRGEGVTVLLTERKGAVDARLIPPADADGTVRKLALLRVFAAAKLLLDGASPEGLYD